MVQTLVIWVTFIAPLQAGAEICMIQTPTVRGQEFARAGSLKFPDGRRITIVGHNHGSRDALEILNRQLRPRAARAAYLAILKEDAESLVDARQDLEFLQEISGSDSQIAIESTAEVARANEQALPNSFSIWAAQARRAGLDEKNVFDLLLLPGGAPYMYRALRLLSGQDVRLLGVESRSAIDAEVAADKVFYKAREKVDHPVQGDRSLVARQILEVIRKLRRSGALLEPLEREKLRQEIAELIPKKFPSEKRQMVAAFLEAGLRSEEASIARDRESAKNLLNLNSSVVFFVGASHSQTLLKLLKKACDQTLPPAPPSPANPAEAQR